MFGMCLAGIWEPFFECGFKACIKRVGSNPLAYNYIRILLTMSAFDPSYRRFSNLVVDQGHMMGGKEYAMPERGDSFGVSE